MGMFHFIGEVRLGDVYKIIQLGSCQHLCGIGAGIRRQRRGKRGEDLPGREVELGSCHIWTTSQRLTCNWE